MADQPLPDLSVVLAFLRSGQGWSQAELAEAAGISASRINDYEKGRRTLTHERLDHLLAFMGLPPETIEGTLACLEANRAASRGGPEGFPAAGHRIEAVAVRAGNMVTDWARSLFRLLTAEGEGLQERQRAEARWARMKRRPPAQRLALVEESVEYRGWALCERIAAESIETAGADPAAALGLAELARRIAELTPGVEAWRWRVQGYALFHVSNLHRVLGDLPKAEKILTRAKELWRAGAPADPGLLKEAVVLGLEANLRKAQRRFPEALERLEEALAADRGTLRARLLLTRAQVLTALGDSEGSTAALKEAAFFVDDRREPRLALGVRFQLLVNLCARGRAAEAEPELAGVRELAERLGQEIDLLRVVWLEGKVAAGLGRTQEARAAFEQVRRELAARSIAYECALASLDLAVLHLEEGRSAAVRALAAEMLWIFQAQQVHREALAALELFREAAERQTATAELARRVADYLHRAQHDPGLPFESGERAGTR